MVFSSLIFLFGFLPLTLSGYYLIPRIKLRNLFLLIASLFFYAWGEPIFVLLIICSVSFNYIMGLLIDGSDGIKKLWFIVAVVFNIGLVAVFKYSAFIVSNVNSILHLTLPVPNIPLPLGISFYTFKILTYIIDVYRGQVKAQRSFTGLALYICLFPQLLAGPIARYSGMEQQLTNRKHSLSLFRSGVERFIIGLAKKIILAGNLAKIADSIFNIKGAAFDTLSAWIGIICYSMQIYLDFSGYSDMAIGLGRMFGFETEENFNYPYISKSVSEFWRRWHISLGSFFRDYVYIPLGGSRSTPLKNYRNLFVVWLLTGLWHGASWSFILWGVYFGLFIALERAALMERLKKAPAFLQNIYLLVVVLIGWIFFRSENISYAFLYFRRLMGAGVPTNMVNPLLILHDNWLLIIISAISCTPLFKKAASHISGSRTVPVFEGLGLALLYIVCIMYLGNSSYNPFIYFKF